MYRLHRYVESKIDLGNSSIWGAEVRCGVEITLISRCVKAKLAMRRYHSYDTVGGGHAKIRRIRLKTQDASSASSRYNTTSLVISDKRLGDAEKKNIRCRYRERRRQSHQDGMIPTKRCEMSDCKHARCRWDTSRAGP